MKSYLPYVFIFSGVTSCFILFFSGQSSLSSCRGDAEHTCRLHRLGFVDPHHLWKRSSTGDAVSVAE